MKGGEEGIGSLDESLRKGGSFISNLNELDFLSFVVPVESLSENRFASMV